MGKQAKGTRKSHYVAVSYLARFSPASLANKRVYCRKGIYLKGKLKWLAAEDRSVESICFEEDFYTTISKDGPDRRTVEDDFSINVEQPAKKALDELCRIPTLVYCDGMLARDRLLHEKIVRDIARYVLTQYIRTPDYFFGLNAKGRFEGLISEDVVLAGSKMTGWPVSKTRFHLQHQAFVPAITNYYSAMASLGLFAYSDWTLFVRTGGASFITSSSPVITPSVSPGKSYFYFPISPDYALGITFSPSLIHRSEGQRPVVAPSLSLCYLNAAQVVEHNLRVARQATLSLTTTKFLIASNQDDLNSVVRKLT